MGGVVGADDDRLLAHVSLGAWVLRAVVLLALEGIHPVKLGNARFARHADGEHELFRPERDFGTVALNDDNPLTRLLVVLGALAARGASVSTDEQDLTVERDSLSALGTAIAATSSTAGYAWTSASTSYDEMISPAGEWSPCNIPSSSPRVHLSAR